MPQMDVETPAARKPDFKPGFRLWPTDIVVLAICGPATWGAWSLIGAMAFIIPVVVAHFFLFCNVFRVGRVPEYVWSGVFLANVIAWAVAGGINWPLVVATQSPVTVGVIAFAISRRDYHGLGHSVLRRSQAEARDAR